jgi:hypothetical protein
VRLERDPDDRQTVKNSREKVRNNTPLNSTDEYLAITSDENSIAAPSIIYI